MDMYIDAAAPVDIHSIFKRSDIGDPHFQLCLSAITVMLFYQHNLSCLFDYWI